MIDPRPSLAMRPPTTWHARKVPFTFTAMTSSNDCSGYDSNGPASSAGASGGESSAAALTSTCGTPHSATTSFVAASSAARSVTSTRYRSATRSNTATRAPRSSSPRTISLPTWPAPPVTTAVLPSREKRSLMPSELPTRRRRTRGRSRPRRGASAPSSRGALPRATRLRARPGSRRHGDSRRR